jgi:hypothetical protein
MISSRQIVDLIRKECKKETNSVIVSAYQKLIDRIEVLEDMDLSRDYRNRFTPGVSQDPALTKEQAIKELDRLFK